MEYEDALKQLSGQLDSIEEQRLAGESTVGEGRGGR